MRDHVKDNSVPISSVVFSKDRAMQLDATLRSFRLQCMDTHLASMTVLYAVSNDTHLRQYTELANEHPGVRFFRESAFKQDLLSLIGSTPYLLFLVDDNIFVKEFLIADAIGCLEAHADVLAFSLRLGRNTTYAYAYGKYQRLPEFVGPENGVLIFDWTKGERDFNYPFDISSTLYRRSDLAPLLARIPFSNPNLLEGHLDGSKAEFSGQPRLACFTQSVTFCNPVNKVQTVLPNNRSGAREQYMAGALAEKFDQGLRINVEAYGSLVPKGCHQEVKLHFRSRTASKDGQASFLGKCLEIISRIYPTVPKRPSI